MGAIQGSINQMLGTAAVASGVMAKQAKDDTKTKIDVMSEQLGEEDTKNVGAAQTKVGEAEKALEEATTAKESYKGDRRKKEYRKLRAQAADAEANVKAANTALSNAQTLQEQNQRMIRNWKNRFANNKSGLIGNMSLGDDISEGFQGVQSQYSNKGPKAPGEKK